MYNPVGITTLIYVASIVSKGLVVFGQGTVNFTLTNRENGILETSLELSCQYTYQGTEITRTATFSRKRSNEPTFSDIATVTIQDPPVNVITADDLKGRSDMFSNRTVVRLVVNNIKCNDRAEYKCRFFISNQSTDFTVNSATSGSLEVKARPKVPQVSFMPSEIIENEAVELSCHGNVGRPAGTLALFLVTNGVETNLNAEVGPIEVETNGCTFERTAKVNHNFTASDSGRTSFRCRAQQELTDRDVHFNETQPFDVLYTPRETKMFHSVDNNGKVAVNPGSMVKVPVGSDVVLMCQTDSNPSALYVWSYVLEGSSDMVTDSPTSTGLFNLKPVRLDQSGQYTCTVNNMIRNVTSTDMLIMSLNVSNVPTTLPPAVTTDGTDTTDPDNVTKKPGENKQEPDQGALIGGIVGGVILVIIIVLIVVLVMRNRRNKQPLDNTANKPKNNQDPKTVVVHPHMVSPQKYDNFDKYNKAFEKNEKDGLYYADLKFDDTPRSRKPVQILAEQTNYAEVAWPRV